MGLKKILIRWVLIISTIFALNSFFLAESSAADYKVSPQEASRVALAWMSSAPDFLGRDGTSGFSPAKDIVDVRDQNDTETIAYVMVLEPRGFIVVSPSFALNPIIAFSSDSNFDRSDTPENILLSLLRNDIPERLAAVRRSTPNVKALEKYNALWRFYLEKVDESLSVTKVGGGSTTGYDVSHGPFLNSVWGQGKDPYGKAVFNYYTPPGTAGSSSNYPSGCVATALGQILNYYEWPLSGTGTHSYLWNNGADTARTLTADYEATFYDWSNVLDNYNIAGTTSTQRKAAGLVTYHAGVAVNMNYSSNGSSAGLSIVEDALENYFRFSGEYVDNDPDNQDYFYSRLYDSMITHRPAELGISGSAGGHAVVVDGVKHNNSGNTTRWYHLNMGWNGTSDAWYDIASDFTAYYVWTTIHGAVLDIVPNPDMIDPGENLSSTNFPVSWSISPNQGSCHYELQQLYIPASISDFSDGAEAGGENWEVDGFWETTNYQKHSGSYAYKGHVYQDGRWIFPGTITFTGSLRFNSNTSISYYWGAVLGQNLELRLEISTDSVNWEALSSHTDFTGGFTWYQETLSSSELSDYVGSKVQLRFVVDKIGASVMVGDSVGVYVDDIQLKNVALGSWLTLDDQITSTTKTINVNQNGDYSYRVRAHCSQWYGWSDVESVNITGATNKVFIPIIQR
jgi:hypothetical protein